MYRYSLLVFLSLVLLGSTSNRVVAQTTGTKSQAPKDVKTLKDPIPSAPMVFPATAEQKSEAKRWYEEGMKLTDAGEFSQAAENFQQAISLNADYAEAYSALGRAYFKMQQWQRAVDNLRRAAELNKKQREAPDAQHRKSMQNLQSSSTESAHPTGSQIRLRQVTNTNAVAVNQLPPISQITQSSVQLKSNPTVMPRVTNPGTKQQADRSNAAVAKPLNPVLGTPRQPEPRKEDSSSVTHPVTNPDTKQRQATNTNATGARPLNPGSSAMRQPEPGKETSSPVLPILKNVDPKQFALDSNGFVVKPIRPESETNRLLETARETSASEQKQEPVGTPASMKLTPTSRAMEPINVSPISTKISNEDISLTKLYRVGPSDVLDVSFNDSQSRKSTLFTVTASGLLEYPMLNEPLQVTGFTVDEIATKIEDELKKQALIENPKVIVGVRDYASHTILVSGLVKDSGIRFLRREAIPLYVVVADAQPLPEAAKVTLVRDELNQIYEIDLAQAAEMNLLVRPGDVITLQPRETQFVYIGGEVKLPGEKIFRRGLTLTQAIITAGGVTGKSRVAEIGREDGQGFLVGTRFNLRDIGSGKTPDPLLRPGDRITILR